MNNPSLLDVFFVFSPIWHKRNPCGDAMCRIIQMVQKSFDLFHIAKIILLFDHVPNITYFNKLFDNECKCSCFDLIRIYSYAYLLEMLHRPTAMNKINNNFFIISLFFSLQPQNQEIRKERRNYLKAINSQIIHKTYNSLY